jgi:hypothetical protein
MAKSDFIPDSDDSFKTWHDRFTAASGVIGGTLGISAGDLVNINTDNASIHTRIAASMAADAAAQQSTRDKKTARGFVETNTRKLAKRLKLHPSYTDALGEQLGIVGPEDTTALANAKPKVKAKALPHGVVEVGWTKGKADGVNIYSKRDNDADYVFLARDTQAPYVDNRPCLQAGKPEQRRYKAICVSNDVEVGQFSDEVVVTCQP